MNRAHGVARCFTDLASPIGAGSTYAAFAAALPSDVCVAFGPGVFRELLKDLGSPETVKDWAVALADRINRPVLLNGGRDGASETVVIAPPGWTRARLQGYVAIRHKEIEAAFGRVESMT